MIHKEVYYWFTVHFPQFTRNIIGWFPNGKNSIRVRQSDYKDFIFTYNGKNDWCFETVDSFIARSRGGREVKC